MPLSTYSGVTMLSYPAYVTPGTRVLRKDADLSLMGMVDEKADGYLVRVQRNYQCHGTYGPEQEIEVLGYMVMVWAPSGRCAMNSTDTLEDLGALIESTKAEADAMCPHSGGLVHVRTLGNCYNEYTCKQCGGTVRIDSSD
jgi:hypothetical protein